MDNRINDMATPGCSYWAPLPVGETQPALPSLQNLSGVRNTVQNIRPLSHLVQATVEPLYLTPPPPGYMASEQVVVNQLRSLVMSMEQQPSAEALAEMTGVSENVVQQALVAGSMPTLPVLSQEAGTLSSTGSGRSFHSMDPWARGSESLNNLYRIATAKADGRVEALQLAYPQNHGEEDRTYAERLAMLSEDIPAIAALTGSSFRSVKAMHRAAVAKNEGRVDVLRKLFPRLQGENISDYVRRLLRLSGDIEAIAGASGYSLSYVIRLRRVVKAEKDGRMERLRKDYPRKDNEKNSEYIRRLVAVSDDVEAISAASGTTTMIVNSLRRTIAAENDDRGRSISTAFPLLDNESNNDYARRLIPLAEDVEAISAASGVSLERVRQLKRIAVDTFCG